MYGGASAGSDPLSPSLSESLSSSTTTLKPSAPLLGNLLTLVASFGYGLYQVLYKIYAALPTDPEVTSEILYEQVSEDQEPDDVDELSRLSPELADRDALYPPPFGLHPNLLTSIVGLATLLILWIPLPLLHWTGAESFALPPDMHTALSILGIALGGMVFNSGFMVSTSALLCSLRLTRVYRFCWASGAPSSPQSEVSSPLFSC